MDDYNAEGRTQQSYVDACRRYGSPDPKAEGKRLYYTTDCEICGRMLEITQQGVERFIPDAVDHDHDKMIVRGRICQSCNTRDGKVRSENYNYIWTINHYGKSWTAKYFAYLRRNNTDFSTLIGMDTLEDMFNTGLSL